MDSSSICHIQALPKSESAVFLTGKRTSKKTGLDVCFSTLQFSEIDLLTKEIFEYIFSNYCRISALGKIATVSKLFKSHADSSTVWNAIIKRVIPDVKFSGCKNYEPEFHKNFFKLNCLTLSQEEFNLLGICEHPNLGQLPYDNTKIIKILREQQKKVVKWNTLCKINYYTQQVVKKFIDSLKQKSIKSLENDQLVSMRMELIPNFSNSTVMNISDLISRLEKFQSKIKRLVEEFQT